ncbi:hypothetical protein AB7254_01380 [Providencia rettgeri]
MNSKTTKLLQHFKYDKCVKMYEEGWRVVREQEESTVCKVHSLTGKKRSSIQNKNRYFLENSEGKQVYISKQTAESLCFLQRITLSKVPMANTGVSIDE